MKEFYPRDSFSSPRFAQPATFMRLPHTRDLARLDVAILGIPFDGGTSYRPGARYGPREIRNQSSLIRPYNHFMKAAPFDTLHIADYGDVDPAPVSIEASYAIIEREIRLVVDGGVFPVAVGGDHSVTLPILRAIAGKRGPLGLIHFDSHPDTWDEYFGGKYFHGTPFRRAVEEKLVDPKRMIQIGIRGPLYGESDFDFQKEQGITLVDIAEVKSRGIEATLRKAHEVARGPVYVSFDIDAVDPAFAPGTGTPEVGGLDSYEAQRLVRGLAGLETVGFDLVEVSPLYDGPGQITSLLAANLIFEFLCTLPPRRR